MTRFIWLESDQNVKTRFSHESFSTTLKVTYCFHQGVHISSIFLIYLQNQQIRTSSRELFLPNSHSQGIQYVNSSLPGATLAHGHATFVEWKVVKMNCLAPSLAAFMAALADELQTAAANHLPCQLYITSLGKAPTLGAPSKSINLMLLNNSSPACKRGAQEQVSGDLLACEVESKGFFCPLGLPPPLCYSKGEKRMRCSGWERRASLSNLQERQA